MDEYSRIIIEEYCMNHPKTKKADFLWEMVHMSYDVACESAPWQLMQLSQLISRERNPELREALEDLAKWWEHVTIPTYDIYTMLADKMAVMCNRVIFRRIKDLYDIYTILHLANISYAQLWQRVERKRPGVVRQSNYMLLPENYDSLKHAFTQFKGIAQSYDFDDIIAVVSYFMVEYMRGDVTIWDHNRLIWKSGE